MQNLKHRFVGSVPEQVDPGILYISLEFKTMIHSCACGCGSEVVTPISPKDWKFTFDGASITVHPSIGNWSLPCRSHYIIRRGNIRWADDWSDEQVARGRAADLKRKRGHMPERTVLNCSVPNTANEQSDKSSLLKRFLDWFS